MNNYEFCANWVLDHKPEKSVHVLDYGCGRGDIIKALRSQNINASGCDVFYEGGDLSISIDAELFDNGIIKRMEGNTIPFDSASFDLIINNQVIEHVEDLDIVLAEMQRVLKPGGLVLSLFPHKSVWRENHCGIPFLHWFPKNSRLRVYYAAGFRTLGFGYFKADKSIIGWSQHFCQWLDKWTYYRTKQEIESTYNKYFDHIQHIEDYWLQQRLVGRNSLVKLATYLPSSIRKLVAEKLAGLTFIAQKPV